MLPSSFPIRDNKHYYVGRLGHDLTIDDGCEAAKIAATNVLLQINKFVGFDRIVGMKLKAIALRSVLRIYFWISWETLVNILE